MKECLGDIETLGSNKRCTDAEAAITCAGQSLGSATTRRDGSRQGHARIPAKQMRVRFRGVTRPVDFWHGTGGTLEEAAKDMLGIPTRTETHVMADGRVLNWTEAERLEDGETVEVMVPMKRGSRKKNANKGKKERNPWNFGCSSEEWSALGKERTVEEWERAVKAALSEWSKSSVRQQGKLNEFSKIWRLERSAERVKKWWEFGMFQDWALMRLW